MGTVWLARRSDGRFESDVAIKLLDSSLVGHAGEERFAREGSFLARLRHPHIANLIDAGVSPSGQPYLVLERVEGLHIDRYCDEQRLDVPGRIRLFLDVLEAVAHAHANLIVHRDIKPSNVLVSTGGAVKLLDFGIATLLASDTGARDATMLTREGGRALTPEYAAPEQMLDEPITTATDVYALGVLLYVLLCGRHPAASATSPAHLVRAIVDAIPARPSDTAASIDDAARVRSTTPERLRRTLRGDLDTIVAKALRKKPAERYASVTAFADDLRRYLQNEPISARPDSLTYRGAKFVRRHARAVAAIAVVVITIAALTIFYTRRLAVERDRARLEAQKSAQVTELLTGLLTGADPYDSRGGSEVTVRGILDAGAARVEKELAGQPDLQAEIFTVIGRVYQRLDEFDKAQPLLEKAVALGRGAASGDSARTAQSLNDLGVLIASRGDPKGAQPVLEDALAMRRRVLGNEHGDVAVTLVELARVFEDQNADDRAEPLLRESLAVRRKVLGEDASGTATSMSDLGLLLLRRGETEEAGRLLEQVLAISRKVLPPNHPDIATAHNNVALISMARGDFARAESEFRHAFAIREQGPAANLTVNHATLANFSAALREQGKYDEAAQAIEQALEVSKPLGVDHPAQATYKLYLARIQIARHRAIEGEQLAREALLRREQLFDNGDWRIGSAKSVLGEALTALGRYREAEPLLLDAHATVKDGPGVQGREAKATRQRLVALYEAWGRPDAAAPYRTDPRKD
jgi:tetratricopeptide (TPR) repeat protein